MKVVDQESGKDLDPSGALAKQHWAQSGTNLSEEPPSKGSVHKARIVSIRAFGAFVELEGYRTNGLVHVSQVHCVWISLKQLYFIGGADLTADKTLLKLLDYQKVPGYWPCQPFARKRLGLSIHHCQVIFTSAAVAAR